MTGYGLAFQNSGTTAHVGDACVFPGIINTSVAEARALVTAMGCRVGRVLRAHASGGIPAGAVENMYVDGALVVLAAPGTTVDIVTNG